jgi:membrane-associated protease RseP (regulator of RpoE activity)
MRSVTRSVLTGALGGTAGWRLHAWLFLATAASVFVTLFFNARSGGDPARVAVVEAAEFTGSLLAILLAHELGHYVAARRHRVSASLPYFIPLPFLSPFGTMGAIIRMRSSIATRSALLDIGAAGPLAGLVIAIPLYAWGAAHSEVRAADGSAGQLGSSLLVRLLDRTFAPVVPDGMDLFLSPVAYAAWAGMFVTMINLLPASQLDGGHVAYALFGPRQNHIARWVHRSMLAFFFVSVASFAGRDLRAGLGLWHLGRHVYNSLFWLVWFQVLTIIGASTSGGPKETSHDQVAFSTRLVLTLGLTIVALVLTERSSLFLWAAFVAALVFLVAIESRWGALRSSSKLLDHPPTTALPLTGRRKVVAIVTLTFFALLFMPAPFVF